MLLPKLQFVLRALRSYSDGALIARLAVKLQSNQAVSDGKSVRQAKHHLSKVGVGHGTHIFRGVEVTVSGLLEAREGRGLVMDGNDTRPPLFLQPMEAADKIQWDFAKGSPKPLDQGEQDAYTALEEKIQGAGGSLTGTVVGPLKKSDGGYVLEVRQFSSSKV